MDLLISITGRKESTEYEPGCVHNTWMTRVSAAANSVDGMAKAFRMFADAHPDYQYVSHAIVHTVELVDEARP